ncbi:MAG: hypothetical protein AVDCRST_MAG78-3558, partial [uncultured Rubrobacteraceae bacterium]
EEGFHEPETAEERHVPDSMVGARTAPVRRTRRSDLGVGPPGFRSWRQQL